MLTLAPRLVSMKGSSLVFREAASHVFASHPVVTQCVRRLQTPALHWWLHNPQQNYWRMTQRWRGNFSRLYARRLIEMAVAAAASRKVMTDLEQFAHRPPSQWEGWERKDWTAELLESLGQTKLERFWMATRRVASLALLASPGIILVPLSYVSDRAKDYAWGYALWGIEHAGPTFIKLVQWATTRQDLFSPEFCQYFGKLRDETKGHSWEETLRLLEEEIGPDHEKLIELDSEPIGSGCIAQVYRGTLKSPTAAYSAGTELAVKVQHPNIWDKVCVDFYIMGKVARFLEELPRLNLSYLSLADTVRQFRDIMLPQLDLTLEAKHLNRFNRDFGSDNTVSFPEPLNELTTPKILTETFMHGTPILEYVNASPEKRHQLAKIGLQTVLKMIFLNDFVHGDLHPGNILVDEGDGQMKLHLLDCGLVVEMGPDQHVNLVKILGAFTKRDGVLAGQLMVDTASKCQASPVDVKLFIEGIERICSEDAENNFLEKVGDYIADICYLACKHKVKLEASFINAALAVEIMEGIASALYPQLRCQQVALPLVARAELMHAKILFENLMK